MVEDYCGFDPLGGGLSLKCVFFVGRVEEAENIDVFW